MQDVGERWLVLELTGSPASAANLATVFVGTSLVAMLPAGVLADRVDRRKMVVIAQLWHMTVASLVGLAAWTDNVTPAVLYAGAAGAGLGMALGGPAWSALVSELVPVHHVADAVTLNAVAFNLARAVGPAVGGVILAWAGATATFFVNAATFLAVIAAVAAHRPPERPPPSVPPPPVGRAFVEPFVRSMRDASIRAVFGSMVLFTLGAAFVYALAPAFAKLTLAAGPRAYGLVLGAMGVGAVLGATTLRRLRATTRPPTLLAAAMLVFGASSMAFSQARAVPLAIALFVPAGVGWTASFSSLHALVQVWTPNRIRARMMALYGVAHLAMWAAGSFVSGLAAERWGVRPTMLVGAAICVGAALVTSRLPLPRSFAAEERAAR